MMRFTYLYVLSYKIGYALNNV